MEAVASQLGVDRTNGTHGKVLINDLIERAPIRYLFISLYCLIILLGILGNTSVLYIQIRYRARYRGNITRYLIFILALCDLLKCCFHQPMRLMTLLLPFTSSKPVRITLSYCKVQAYGVCLLSGIAMHTIVAIGLERYLLICHPLRSKPWTTVRNSLKGMIAIAVMAAGSFIPIPIVFSKTVQVWLNGIKLDFCFSDLYGNDPLLWKVYFTIVFGLYYIIPVILLVFFYSAIFRTLNAGYKDIQTPDVTWGKLMRQRKAAAKVMISIAAVYTVLHTPYFLGYLVLTYKDKFQPRNPIFNLLLIELLVSTNSALNPFIYCAQSRSFFKGKMFAFMSSANVSDMEPQSRKGIGRSSSKIPFLRRYVTARQDSTHSLHKNHQHGGHNNGQEPPASVRPEEAELMSPTGAVTSTNGHKPTDKVMVEYVPADVEYGHSENCITYA